MREVDHGDEILPRGDAFHAPGDQFDSADALLYRVPLDTERARRSDGRQGVGNVEVAGQAQLNRMATDLKAGDVFIALDVAGAEIGRILDAI